MAQGGKGARTTLKIREEIRNSPLSVYALSKKYNLSWNTVKKWKERDDIYDKSFRPNKLNTTVTKEKVLDIVDLGDELIEFINDYNIKAKLKSLDYMLPKEHLLKNHNINIHLSLVNNYFISFSKLF